MKLIKGGGEDAKARARYKLTGLFGLTPHNYDSWKGTVIDASGGVLQQHHLDRTRVMILGPGQHLRAIPPPKETQSDGTESPHSD